MSPASKPASFISAQERLSALESAQHPWNPRSGMQGLHLSRKAGLQRCGVSWVRLDPGKESFAYHAHHVEEEWIFVLEGQGEAYVDGQTLPIGAGDFLAFPTPSVAHLLRNTGSNPLLYLMGGENREFEVADFPELNRRMVKSPAGATVYRLSDGQRLADAFSTVPKD
jgi:uncharacterized cupin superfamily protein